MKRESQILEIIRVLSNTQDANLLDQVSNLIKEAMQREIAGYEPDGKPITHQDLVDSLKEAEEDIKEGRLYTGGEMLKEFEEIAQNG